MFLEQLISHATMSMTGKRKFLLFNVIHALVAHINRFLRPEKQ